MLGEALTSSVERRREWSTRRPPSGPLSPLLPSARVSSVSHERSFLYPPVCLHNVSLAAVTEYTVILNSWRTMLRDHRGRILDYCEAIGQPFSNYFVIILTPSYLSAIFVLQYIACSCR